MQDSSVKPALGGKKTAFLKEEGRVDVSGDRAIRDT